MKFVITVDSFISSLIKLNSVVSNRSPLKILENILLEIKDDKLTLLSSDLDIFIKTTVEVKNESKTASTAEKCAIPSKKLLDLVRSLSHGLTKKIFETGFSQEDHDKILASSVGSSLFNDNFKYNYAKKSLTLSGSVLSDEKEALSTRLKEAEESSKENDDLKGSLAELKASMKDLFKMSDDFTSKSKISVEVSADNKMKIKTKTGKYVIAGENAEDFPMPEEADNFSSIKFEGSVLRKILSRIYHAASTDDRRTISGILFDLRKNESRFVATDSYRLAKVVRNVNFEGNEEKLVLPIKTCELILKLNQDKDTTIFYTETDLKVEFGEVVIYSKLISEPYPNYESVIPKDSNKTLKIERAQLMESLNRALIFADVITKRVKMEVKNKSLSIQSENPSTGFESEESLDCNFTANAGDIDFDEEPFSIAFNTKYLLEAIQHLDTDEVLIKMNSPTKASILYPTEQQENEEFIELIMPVRIS